MSQSTKRKHVTKEVLDEFELPKENQKIVKIVAGRGNNLHQAIEADDQTTYLVSMPTKFRKNVWIKRGDFCIVEAIEEGDKVKAEIVRILYKDQIRFIKSENLWPFKDLKEVIVQPPTNSGDQNSQSDDEDDSDLFQNPNRPPPVVQNQSSSDSEEDSDTD
jgi:probable RNA-binding protein EIF1AD